jgi:hypothetical protein
MVTSDIFHAMIIAQFPCDQQGAKVPSALANT